MNRGWGGVTVLRIPILGIGVAVAALLAGTASAQRVRVTSQSAQLNAQGLTLYQAGKVDEAIAAFRQAVAADPKNSEAFTNLGLAGKMLRL
jgi:Flp pilus assembly protein TadD